MTYERAWLFERSAFTQEHVDRLILEGGVPVYRDPSHPADRATITRTAVRGMHCVWAHPSTRLQDVVRWNELVTR